MSELDCSPLTLDRLYKLIEKAPTSLSDCYRDILSKIKAEDSLEAAILIENVLRAHRPLSVEETAHICEHAMQSASTPGHRPYVNSERVPNEMTMSLGLRHVRAVHQNVPRLV